MVVLRFTLDNEPEQWVAPVDLVKGYMSTLRGMRRLVIPVRMSDTTERKLKLVFLQKKDRYLIGATGFSSPTQYLLYQSAIPLTSNTAKRLISTLEKNKQWRRMDLFEQDSFAPLYRL